MRISDWSSDVCSSDLGGLTAATLFVLIATGIVLAQFYNPMPEAANASVRDIVTDVWAGQFLRGVHYWAAQAMYVLAALHLRSEEHTSELQSLMRISYAVFCLTKKNK